MNGKRTTGPLSPSPQFETHIAPPDPNLRDALLSLDVMDDYCYSADLMVSELMFNFGYSTEEARAVIKEWERMQP
jgi:hypothetical protein